MNMTEEQYMRLVGGRRKGKYHNVKVVDSAGVFDSKREYARWRDLAALQSAGEISSLARQVTFRIVVNDVPVCKYVADFVYVENGKRIVEDVKGVETAAFKLKKKLMLAVHGIDIRIVK
jgi:hypothetical protein